MKIADICTRSLVMAERDASLQQAASLMREHHVGTLVVVAKSDEGMQAVGIVTDRDVVIEAVARGLDMLTPIGRLAEGKLAVVQASAGVDEAISAMKERGVRRLLVADDGGQLYGIVSLDDVVQALAHQVGELGQALRGGIQREVSERAPLPAAQPPAAAVRIPAYRYA